MNDQSDQEYLIALGRKSYAPNYRPRDVVFESGKGCELTDVSGKKYLDFGSGIGVNCLGHQHPAVVDALQRQSARLWHSSNVYFNRPAVRLAARFIELTFAERVFFCNSGAEANEAAIKVARRYSYDRGYPNKNIIITLQGSFHGRTLAAVTATAQPKYQEGFGPLPAGFQYCNFNDIDHLRSLFTENVCALMLEPIQGEGGIRPVSDEFLQSAAELCQANDALLITDEIQSGMGRTGKLFAHQWVSNIRPDIVTVAKALGAGLPIGAVLLGDKPDQTLQVGSHGSTFGGNPIACAVANVVLDTLHTGCMLDEIVRKGDLICHGLNAINDKTEAFCGIRNRGMMIGAELSDKFSGKAGRILKESLEKGLLVLQAGDNVVRLLPAYTISDAEIQTGLVRLQQAIESSLSYD